MVSLECIGQKRRALLCKLAAQFRKAIEAYERCLTIEPSHYQAATNIGEAPIRSSQERDEAYEAYRALRAGGYTLAALFLRQRDPRGALSLLDSAGLERLMSPELRDLSLIHI